MTLATRIAKLKRLLDSDRPLSKLEEAVYKRQIDDLNNGHKRGLFWDEAEAVRAHKFIGLLSHWKGRFAGRPLDLDDWQAEGVIAPLFGWRIASTGLRRFKSGYIEIPRKNGKTTLAAGIGLFCLMADHEQGAEVYCAATKRDQARLLFTDARNLLRRSKVLKRLVKLNANSITVPRLNGKMAPVSSQGHSLDGLNLHCGIIDELHAHKSRDVYDVLTTASGARLQPLLICITTAGYDRTTVCWEQHEYTESVLLGKHVDDTHFGFISCADPNDSWSDPATWWKANPNLGVSISQDFLAAQALKAQQSPSFENTFRRLYLNQWTEQENRWLKMSAWNNCGFDFIPEDLIGQPCWAGVDLSKTQDTTAVVLVFPRRKIFYVTPWFFIPEEGAIAHERDDHVPYVAWSQKGLMKLTPGEVVDYESVLELLFWIRDTFDLRQIGIDPWNAGLFIQRCLNEGLPVVEFPQTLRNLADPSKEFERLIVAGDLRHPQHPVLDWQAGNVSIKRNADGHIRPVKPKDAKKIDGIVASIMALALAVQGQGENPTSVYEKRGFQWL